MKKVARSLSLWPFILLSAISSSALFRGVSPAAPPHPLVYDVGIKNRFGAPLLTVPRAPRESSSQLLKTVGVQGIAVIGIEFTDIKHRPQHDRSYFHDLIFARSPKRAGIKSLFNYYKEVSYGRLLVDDGDGDPDAMDPNNIVMWVQSRHRMSYYGEDGTSVDNRNADISELVREAIYLADPKMDFSRLDLDGDRFVDHLIVIHAGGAQERTGNPVDIWSHRWEFTVPVPTGDGVAIRSYILVSEDSPVGIIAHEFGHDIGLVDLYNVITYETVAGFWDIMDQGAWLDDGKTPSHPGAWTRMLAGWIQAEDGAKMEKVYMIEVYQKGSLYKFVAGADGKEYFLVENRHRVGFDLPLPGQGLLIWHVDERYGDLRNNAINVGKVRRVDLVEADNTPTTTDPMDPRNATDPFFEGNNSEFTPFTSPSSRSNDGYDTGIYIVGIGVPGEIMYVYGKKVGLQFLASQCYPVPSRGERVKIKFSLSKAVRDEDITVSVYNVLGQLVYRTKKVSQLDLDPPTYIVEFPPSGRVPESGVYIYVIDVRSSEGNLRRVGKMVIAR